MSFIIKLRSGDEMKPFTFESLPESCPHCHKFIEPNLISVHEVPYDEFCEVIEVFMVCPDINKCGHSFIGIYSEYGGEYALSSVTFGKPLNHIFDPMIKDVSSTFVKIYNEAYFAEQHKLLEICGVGYRKALEFLIKDYAKYNHPDQVDAIEKQLLSPCITNYVTDSRIRSVATRAVWLGNDETHYIRKWEGKDLKDLKKLIELTVHWIQVELLTRSFEDDMPT